MQKFLLDMARADDRCRAQHAAAATAPRGERGRVAAE